MCECRIPVTITDPCLICIPLAEQVELSKVSALKIFLLVRKIKITTGCVTICLIAPAFSLIIVHFSFYCYYLANVIIYK